jgi:IS30 family transposase
MTGYHQLTREQRYQLEAFLANGERASVAARALKVGQSTISRELRRNATFVGGRLVYRAELAQLRCEQRRKDKGKASRKIRDELKLLVETKLSLGWSPEQICGRLFLEKKVRLSHETIYQHVIRNGREGGSLRYLLRHAGHGYRRLRKTRYVRISERSPRRSIHERPFHVELRRQTGHWERDLVLSTRTGPSLLAIVERATSYTLVRWLRRYSASAVAEATSTALKRFQVRSLTNDNGSEFAKYADTEAALGAPNYFTDPGKPWQRGSVENTAGLLRQYFPKRNSFKSSHAWSATAMQHTLNTRPRKSLQYRTPHEALFRQRLHLFSRQLMHFGLETGRPF